MTQKIIQQGAEAKIILDKDIITKNRIKKSYRISELDDKIRKLRTRSEIKLLTKSSKIIPVPLPLTTLKKSERGDERAIIQMPFINGKKLSDELNKFPLKQQLQICKQIGENVAKLHDTNIIHGDLTTSNMILVEKFPAHSHSQINKNSVNKKQKTQLSQGLSFNKFPAKKSSGADFVATSRTLAPNIFFIDFGLGFISHKIEDKAVDLHLLKQALEAKHFQNWEELFDAVVKGYSNSKNFKKILEKLKAVENRGRYKH